MHCVATDLIDYLLKRESFPLAQYHYKIEEWAATEAFCFFHDKPMRDKGWCPSRGPIPYDTRYKDKKEKWCDVYARRVTAGRSAEHVWIEFKAVPSHSASSPKTMQDFLADAEALRLMDRGNTELFWRSGKNPRKVGRAQHDESAWFKKFEGYEFEGKKKPKFGVISDGEFVGFAILIAPADDLLKAQMNLPMGLSTVEFGRSRREGKGLGCLIYEVRPASR